MHTSITNPEDNTKEVNCVHSRIQSLTQISNCKTSNKNDSKGVTYKIKRKDFKYSLKKLLNCAVQTLNS
jgi:hypothetical protein